ncbi:NAD(P)/FAD-dependent oxidoreductase [Congregibacter litoralis]|uniref:Flavoprotein family n=1 Tax=Congregibacter litoralis KT71 TaxID=314285 RepID=A4AA27_9GAMM|nr:NAD(P)/FAD-dependent oxidoreductase [Congregibacter litoralis]EAQ97344.1 flavoprotein family [Congregibacter litoralis KT71]
MSSPSNYDVIIVGGGASGLMCAISAGYRGLRVLVLEQGPKVGLKILVSGGGRCNFTNVFADPREHYLSQNPNFCISAMKRFSPADFIQMVETAGIDYHEKKLGQLFCDHSAKDIVAMLLEQCSYAGVEIRLRQAVQSISPKESQSFVVATDERQYRGTKVVIAAGGLSMPKIASDLAFRTAKELGLKLNPPRAALVPLTWNSSDKSRYGSLSGISTEVIASCQGHSFRENLLFTHRGLSGPAILQISSFWREGLTVDINLLPDCDAGAWLLDARERNPQQRLMTVLKTQLPNRLVDLMFGTWFDDQKIGSFSPPELRAIGERLNDWSFMPGGSEGYRTAEVTLGGIDTDEVSSKTFELKRVPGMFAIGEALDVTGWLGGYNFQWAWASGWCCGQHL